MFRRLTASILLALVPAFANCDDPTSPGRDSEPVMACEKESPSADNRGNSAYIPTPIHYGPRTGRILKDRIPLQRPLDALRSDSAIHKLLSR